MSVEIISKTSNYISQQERYKKKAPYFAFFAASIIFSFGLLIADHTIKTRIPLIGKYFSKLFSISATTSLIAHISILTLIGPLFDPIKRNTGKNQEKLLAFAKILENFKEEIGIFDSSLKAQIEKILKSLKEGKNTIVYIDAFKKLQNIEKYLKQYVNPNLMNKQTFYQMVEEFLYQQNRAVEILFKELKGAEGFSSEITIKKMQEWFNDPQNIPFLESIEELDLSKHSLKVLPQEIGKLSFLKALDLGENTIINFQPLKTLENLEILKISNTNIQDNSFLRKFKNLQYLELSNCRMKDLHFLDYLKKIGQLNIKGSKISDRESLKNKTRDKFTYEHDGTHYFWDPNTESI